MLITPLDRVKSQCAFLAGHGIQGDLLANVLYKCNNVILIPQQHLAMRIRYLYNELGCTPEVRTCSQCSPQESLHVPGLPDTSWNDLVWLRWALKTV